MALPSAARWRPVIMSLLISSAHGFSAVPFVTESSHCRTSSTYFQSFPKGLNTVREKRPRSSQMKRFSTSLESDIQKNCEVVSCMPEPLPELKNSYFLLRHGQSEGNVEGVISSARSLATSEKHGLTKLGYEQGVESAANLLDLLEQQHESSEDKRKVIFYSSPFSRARQTAQACLDGMRDEAQSERAKQIGVDIQLDMIIEDGLMERFFGRLDAEPLSTYGYVWPVDMINVTHTEYDVESVAAVSTRIREAILKIDEQHENGNIVLVSHADVLQITQCYAAGLPNVGLFSQYRFGNGEVRAMQRSESSLPEPAPLDPPEKA